MSFLPDFQPAYQEQEIYRDDCDNLQQVGAPARSANKPKAGLPEGQFVVLGRATDCLAEECKKQERSIEIIEIDPNPENLLKLRSELDTRA